MVMMHLMGSVLLVRRQLQSYFRRGQVEYRVIVCLSCSLGGILGELDQLSVLGERLWGIRRIVLEVCPLGAVWILTGRLFSRSVSSFVPLREVFLPTHVVHINACKM